MYARGAPASHTEPDPRARDPGPPSYLDRRVGARRVGALAWFARSRGSKRGASNRARTFESVDRGRLARITNRSRRRSTPRRTRETRTSARRLKSRALARFARTVVISKSQPLGISYCRCTDGPVLAANGAVVRRWFFFARNPWGTRSTAGIARSRAFRSAARVQTERARPSLCGVLEERDAPLNAEAATLSNASDWTSARVVKSRGF